MPKVFKVRITRTSETVIVDSIDPSIHQHVTGRPFTEAEIGSMVVSKEKPKVKEEKKVVQSKPAPKKRGRTKKSK